MDVRLPDGTIVTNVPEGMTQSELLRRLGRTPAPSQDFLANTMASMTMANKSPLERAMIQLGAGVDTTLQGARQLMAGKDDRQAIDREVAQTRPLKRALAAQSDTGTLPDRYMGLPVPTGGSTLQATGEALPLMAVPVGTYAQAAKMLPRAFGLMRGAAQPARIGTGTLMLDSALAGGASGALNPVIEDESRGTNVLLGTAGGAVLPAITGGVQGGINMIRRGGQNRAGAQIAQELSPDADPTVLRQTIDRLRAGQTSGGIPLSTAAQLRDPQLARLEAGSRARSGANWYDFDQAQAKAVSDEVQAATRGAQDVDVRRAMRSRNRELLFNQAMGSVNEPAFARDLVQFRSNLDVAERTAEASNPAVRNMLKELRGEIDRLGDEFTPEHLAVIRANLASKAPLMPTNAFQAAPRESPATMSVLKEIDAILNNATGNRWSPVLQAYKRDSDTVRASQAAGKVRDAFVDAATGRIRGVAADAAGDVPKITEAGLGRAMDAARGPRKELVMDPTANARLQAVLDALRAQNIVQGVKRSATAGGGSNTASDQLAAQAASRAGDVVAGMAGNTTGAITRSTLQKALDFANERRDQALAKALQDPNFLIQLLENRIKAGTPLSATEQGVYSILRGVTAASATN